MNHTAYFGDAVRTFALSDAMIEELQHKTGIGIGALYARVRQFDFHGGDHREIIHCGLIGGGTSPVEAQRLIDAYAKDRPFGEIMTLAMDILVARWLGTDDQSARNGDDFEISPDLQQAARTGDMSAAIDETLAEAGIE